MTALPVASSRVAALWSPTTAAAHFDDVALSALVSAVLEVAPPAPEGMPPPAVLEPVGAEPAGLEPVGAEPAGPCGCPGGPPTLPGRARRSGRRAVRRRCLVRRRPRWRRPRGLRSGC